MSRRKGSYTEQLDHLCLLDLHGIPARDFDPRCDYIFGEVRSVDVVTEFLGRRLICGNLAIPSLELRSLR